MIVSVPVINEFNVTDRCGENFNRDEIIFVSRQTPRLINRNILYTFMYSRIFITFMICVRNSHLDENYSKLKFGLLS